MYRFWAYALTLGIVMSVGMLSRVEAQETVSPSSPLYQKALYAAKVVDGLIRATRKHYTQMVVKKLKNDGAGASLEYESAPGFAPLPAVFIRRVVFETAYQQTLAKEWLYDTSLVSKWNLNEDRSLQSTFIKRGWDALIQQQSDHLATGKTLKDLRWQPHVEVGQFKGQPVLKYLSADPASARACVTCHNAWESKEEIQTRRRQQGIEVGKQFQRHELMGALSIIVPLR